MKMTDKERLGNLNPTIVDNQGNVTLKGDDYHWLMELAEKAEKYREALEFYALRGNYIPISHHWYYEESAIEKDKGEIARKVLEGTE